MDLVSKIALYSLMLAGVYLVFANAGAFSSIISSLSGAFNTNLRTVQGRSF